MENKFALYTFFDDNFILTGLTMINSFLENNEWFNGDIVVLCDEGKFCPLSEDNRDLLLKFDNRIKVKEVNSSDYQPIWDNLSQKLSNAFMSCYYKLEVFKKDDYSVKFFIDADSCFINNVRELFFIENMPKILLCKDTVSQGYLHEDYIVKRTDYYANMGFLLVNGDLLTEMILMMFFLFVLQ